MKDKKENMTTILKTVAEMIACVAVIYLIFTFVVVPIRIQGASMENGLEEGEMAFVNAIGSKSGHVDRFDVVVLQSETLDEKIIKRVIGLSGDHIEYKDDKLYVNGEYVNEYFLDSEFVEDSKKLYNVSCFTDDFSIDVGEDEIFVLGDNRLRSTDSRELGCFSYDDVIGKNGIIIYPFNQVKWLG